MRHWALLLALFWSTLSASASKGIAVADLERTLVADHGKPDAQIAQQLSDFVLTERLSATTVARLESLSPGPQTTQRLKLLADQSEFLPLPTAEIPPAPAPDFADQRKIMALVVNYVSKTIHELPNFYATRITTSFEETPLIQRPTYSTPYRPLHPVSASETTVLYRDGREVVETARSASNAAKPQARGLNATGVFGPILTLVFLDAAKSTLGWGHWEQGPSGARAVFRYAVPQQHSQYRATYCCIPDPDPSNPPTKPFDQIVGYHGEIAVNPLDGSIVRLTVIADLKPSDPIQRADIMVEYGPVEIGGKTYICATRSIALSSALSTARLRADPGLPAVVTTGPPQTLLNDVAFERYHMFLATTRILTADETQEPPVPVATPTPQQIATDLPSQQPAKEPEPTPLIAAAAPTELPASQPPPPSNDRLAPPTHASTLDQPTVFKVTTRQVIVDVVATKSDGQVLSGLSKQDFEVKENSKPQTINFFQEHTTSSAAQTTPPEMPAMPAGTRTNVPPASPADAVNVLLIDTLNTDVSDQAVVRKLIINFLSKLPQGPRFAIFTLGSQLLCLQGFTSDSSALLATLNDPKNGLKIKKDASFQSQSDKESAAADIAALQMEQASPYGIEALQSALAEIGNQKATDRASMTYEALMYLGHYLSGIPGRKNLIWFSGSFPIVVVPTAEQMASLTRRTDHPEILARVKQTAELFTASQIAIYPISATGMAVSPIDAATTFAPGGGGGHQGSQDPSSIIASYMPGPDSGSAMEQLATSTGGKAFYNTNDLDGALKHSIDDGSHYYTIGYSPSDKNMDGSYRKIEIKSLHGRSKLAYRRGYIANDASTPASKAKVDPLAPLLRLGLPGATGILYGVRAKPTATQPSPGDAPAGQNPNLKTPTTRYTVDFTIRSQDLLLQQSPQGDWTGKLLLGLKAYDLNGNALNWSAEGETLAIPPDQLASLSTSGITAQVDIDVPTIGPFHLVTAVYDPASGTAGTLEIPLQTASH